MHSNFTQQGVDELPFHNHVLYIVICLASLHQFARQIIQSSHQLPIGLI
jgi:hypothetical protein